MMTLTTPRCVAIFHLIVITTSGMIIITNSVSFHWKTSIRHSQFREFSFQKHLQFMLLETVEKVDIKVY